LFEDVTTIFGVAQNQHIHGQCILEVFQDTNVSTERQAFAVHDTLVFMNVKFIYKLDYDTVMLDALNRQK
jgi:hypothetical protein